MILWLECKVLPEVIQEQEEEQLVDNTLLQDPFRFLQLRWRP
jgi:ribosome-associated toxin RatA of RatAB toxin-antitoxin module